MNQVLEFLAENYIYVAGGSAVVIVILLFIIALGNKNSRSKIKSGNVSSTGTNSTDLGTNNIDMVQVKGVSEVETPSNNYVVEPVLESVPVVNTTVGVIPSIEPVVPTVEPSVSETPVVTETVSTVNEVPLITPSIEPVVPTVEPSVSETPVVTDMESKEKDENTESLEVFGIE